jgi:hypothetical protein
VTWVFWGDATYGDRLCTKELHAESHRNADLVAHFFRRAQRKARRETDSVTGYRRRSVHARVVNGHS